MMRLPPGRIRDFALRSVIDSLARVLSGNTEPDDADGEDGDVYVEYGGAQVGVTVYVGDDAPANTLGADGSVYVEY